MGDPEESHEAVVASITMPNRGGRESRGLLEVHAVDRPHLLPRSDPACYCWRCWKGVLLSTSAQGADTSGAQSRPPRRRGTCR